MRKLASMSAMAALAAGLSWAAEPASGPAPAAPVKTLGAYSDTGGARRGDVVAGLRRELDSLGMLIDTLKVKSGKATAKAKEDAEVQIKKLDARRRRIGVKIDSLGKATAKTFEEVKRTTVREVDSLKASINRLWKKL